MVSKGDGWTFQRKATDVRSANSRSRHLHPKPKSNYPHQPRKIISTPALKARHRPVVQFSRHCDGGEGGLGLKCEGKDGVKGKERETGGCTAEEKKRKKKQETNEARDARGYERAPCAMNAILRTTSVMKWLDAVTSVTRRVENCNRPQLHFLSQHSSPRRVLKRSVGAMPEIRELLAAYIFLSHAFTTLIWPTGTRILDLWYDNQTGVDEPREDRHKLRLVGRLIPSERVPNPERMRTSLWPSHLSLHQVRGLRLEKIEYNCRCLFLKFLDIYDQETWMSVSVIVFSFCVVYLLVHR